MTARPTAAFAPSPSVIEKPFWQSHPKKFWEGHDAAVIWAIDRWPEAERGPLTLGKFISWYAAGFDPEWPPEVESSLLKQAIEIFEAKTAKPAETEKAA